MHRALKGILAVATFLVLFPHTAAAQVGQVAGTVRDSSGAVMPGVTVEVTSPALIEKVRSTTTDGSGQYRIANLPVGTYSVAFTLAGFSTVERDRIVEFANHQRQRAVYGLTEFADAGGLMSYSYSLVEQYRAAATFVDKILKGASPSEIPVVQPTRFELVLNLRTAKTQGVAFPRAVLLSADRVID